MGRCVGRRELLRGIVGVAGAAAGEIPYFWTSATAQELSKNDRPHLALIGMGGHGSFLGRRVLASAEVVAGCDVDRRQAEKCCGSKGFAGRKVDLYEDFRRVLDRKDVEAVLIATPDHWHASIALAALKAGKDVYCESPLALTIEEGRLVRKAVRQSKRVFQAGTQQRSEYSQAFLKAVALARAGKLGKPLTATCFIGTGKKGGPFPTKPVPDGLNWDLWLGPAPKVDYSPERCHGNFRWWLEYSGGKLTDWGVHHMDIAQWALGCENTGASEIEGSATFPAGIYPEEFNPVEFLAGRQKIANGYNTPTDFDVTLEFAGGNTIVVKHGPTNGVLLEGPEGDVYVSRNELKGKAIDALSGKDKDWLEAEVARLYRGRQPGDHLKDFLACLKDRTEPISDVATHHRAVTSCHQCVLALLLKRRLHWDYQQEDFLRDDEASLLRSRPHRLPYAIEG